MRVALRATQNKYAEEDKTNPCSKYPNKEFRSYRDCDEKFVNRVMKTKWHLMPFWATDNMSDVTEERCIKGNKLAFNQIFIIVIRCYNIDVLKHIVENLFRIGDL